MGARFDDFELTPLPYPEEAGADLVEWYTGEALRRIALGRAMNSSPSITREIEKHCAADFFFYADNFAWTFDPRDLGPTRPAHELPMHLWEFQRWLATAGTVWKDDNGLGWPRLVEKSRDMGVSWVAGCHEILWGWKFHGRSYGVVARKQEDVDDNSTAPDSLLGRMRWSIERWPKALRPTGWKHCHIKRPRFADKDLHLINGDTKNQIIGSSTVDGAFRSRRFSKVFVDEANSIPGLYQMLKSLTDCSDVVDLVSSVQGRHTTFAKIAHGESGVAVRAPRHGPPPTGVGVLVCRVHYSMHPHKDPTTARGQAWQRRERARPGRDEAAWAQEQEIDYFASLPSRCWPEFSRADHVHSARAWASSVEPMLDTEDTIWRLTFDYGYGTALTVATLTAYVPSWDLLYVVWSLGWVDAEAEQVAAELGEQGIRTSFGPGRQCDRILGDPSGENAGPSQHGGKQLDFAPSWVMNLAEVGIVVEPSSAKPYAGITLVRRMIKHGRVRFGPQCIESNDQRVPPIVDAVESHTWTNHNGVVTLRDGRPTPAKNTAASHAADTLIYAVWDVWGAELGDFENLEQGDGYRGTDIDEDDAY